MAALQSQQEQREDTLQRQFLEESQATQDDLYNTKQRLEEVETWLEEAKASKQQDVNQAQQEIGVLQDSSRDMLSKWDALREETQGLVKQFDQQLSRIQI